MAVVVVWVSGAGSEAIDADERAGIGTFGGIFVIRASRVVVADIERPLSLEGRDVISSIQIETTAVSGEVCQEAFIRRPIQFPVYDREVGIYIVVLPGHVLS